MDDQATELRAAVADRPHWSVDGSQAVYDPPGRDWTARVQPVARPTSWRDAWSAIQLRGGLPAHASVFPAAKDAVLL